MVSHFRMVQRLLMCCVSAIVLLGAGASTAYASHFRYTTIDYKPILDAQGNPTGTVEFHITEAWRRSAFGGLVTGQAFQPSSFSFGDGSSARLSLTVTSYSITEDWIVGTQTIQHHYLSAGPFTASDTGCCRIGNISNGAGGGWYFDTVVRPYSTNSSPTSSLPPILNVPAGNNATFFVRASDVDRNTLTYRIASNSGVSAIPNLSIASTTGQVTWNNSSLDRTNFWSVQFLVEDHDAEGNVLSRIPVDVLVRIVTPSGQPPTLLIDDSNASPSYSIAPGTPVSFSVKGVDNTGITGDAVTLNVSGLPAGASLNPTLPVSAAGSVESTFAWTPTAANGGSHTITFSATDGAGQATLNSVTIFVEVNKPPAITCSQPITTQYQVAAPFSVNISDPNGDALIVAWELDGVGIRTDNVPGSSSASTLTASRGWGAVGMHTVTVSATDSKNASAMCSATVTVDRADQTIDFGAIADRMYGDPSFGVTATATSNLPVSFSIVAGPATLGDGNVITVLGAGTITLRAAQAGDDNYKAAPDVEQAFTVGRPALTVKGADQSRGYGDPTPALTGSLAGVVNGDPISATYATEASVTSGVGSYAIVPSLVDPSGRLSNYTVTILDGTLTITPAFIAVVADDASRKYGAANPEFTGAISGVRNGDAIVAAFTTPATPESVVGSYAIVPSLSGAALSNYATPVVQDGILTVEKAGLTVKGAHDSRLYGDPNPVLTGSIAGVVNGDPITASYSTVASTTSAVGAYPIVPALADPNGRLSNYLVTIVNGALTVAPASISVTAHDGARIYGAANPELTGEVAGVRNGDAIVATYSTAAVASSPVGSYAIVPALSGAALSNYSAPAIHDGQLTIGKASIAVKADDQRKLYGSANPPLTGVIAGVVNGDAIVPSYSTTATATSGAGSYPIHPSLADPDGRLGNYDVAMTDGSLTVTPAPLTVMADDSMREFGTSNPAFTVHYSGFQHSDSPASLTGTLTFVTPAGPTTMPGTYPIVPSGPSSANYALTFVAGTLTVRDTTAPAVTVPANIILEATSPMGAAGTFVASALDAVDGSTAVNCTPISGSMFAFGTTRVTCASTDAHSNTGSSSFTVTVRDTTKPAIASVTPGIGSLWPPNHKMVARTIAVVVDDAADAAPVCRIASVTSNEPVGADGDWVITGALSVSLRAERLGGGAGRVYTIGVSCTDASGNTSSKTTMVTVAHDQGN